MLQHILPLFRIGTDIGRHIWQDRFFIQVVFDDLGDISINHLVIRHPASRRIGQCDVPGLIGSHETRHPQQRILAKNFRIEEVVINPAIDDIDLLEPFRGPHPDAVIKHDQVIPDHQFRPQLLRQKTVFKISGIEGPG